MGVKQQLHISKETLARSDVLIDVVWGGGTGGVLRGAVRRYEKYHAITALMVDSDPLAEQTHALSMPHIPKERAAISPTRRSHLNCSIDMCLLRRS